MKKLLFGCFLASSLVSLESLAGNYQKNKGKNQLPADIKNNMSQSSHSNSSKSGMHWGDGKMFFTASVGAEKSMSLGAGSNLNTPKMNATLGFGVGRELNEKLALGLDYVFTPNHKAKSKNFTANINGANYNLTSHGKLNSHALFITGRYNIAGNERFTPFVKLGAGMARNSMLYGENVESVTAGGAAQAQSVGTSTTSVNPPQVDELQANFVESEAQVQDQDDSPILVQATQTSQITTKNPRKHSTHFAWQIGGGIDIKINEKFSTTISYSYVDKGKLKLINTYYNGDNSMADQTGGSTNVTNKLRAHSVSLALKVNF